METKNAIIAGATLRTDDHGCLVGWVDLDYGGSGQGFGGYALYLPKSLDHHKLHSIAGHFIWRVMEIAGVGEWGKLRGQTVRVQADHGKVHAIGHIVRDDWFNPSEDFKEESDE